MTFGRSGRAARRNESTRCFVSAWDEFIRRDDKIGGFRGVFFQNGGLDAPNQCVLPQRSHAVGPIRAFPDGKNAKGGRRSASRLRNKADSDTLVDTLTSAGIPALVLVAAEENEACATTAFTTSCPDRQWSATRSCRRPSRAPLPAVLPR